MEKSRWEAHQQPHQRYTHATPSSAIPPATIRSIRQTGSGRAARNVTWLQRGICLGRGVSYQSQKSETIAAPTPHEKSNRKKRGRPSKRVQRCIEARRAAKEHRRRLERRCGDDRVKDALNQFAEEIRRSERLMLDPLMSKLRPETPTQASEGVIKAASGGFREYQIPKKRRRTPSPLSSSSSDESTSGRSQKSESLPRRRAESYESIMPKLTSCCTYFAREIGPKEARQG